METNLKQKFYDYFSKNDFVNVPESSLIPPNNDKSILFTNSGMNQFKNIFLGKEKSKYKYIYNSQHCVRVGGKHNDFDDVGHDTYHHTMFEMLGLWIFDINSEDFYNEKVKVLKLVWHFLTKICNLDEKRMYITYYKGNDVISEDVETKNIWINEIGIDENKIIPFGDKDNFWKMAEDGPCGPCTEIHYDLLENRNNSQNLVNKDDPTLIELWNNVFIQYNSIIDDDENHDFDLNKIKKYKLERLDKCHVDIGGGYERIITASEHLMSNYDSSIFTPLINIIKNNLIRKHDLDDEKLMINLRICADHMRSIIYILMNDITPGTTSREYILSKIIRRVMICLYINLNCNMSQFANITIEIMNYLSEYDKNINSYKNLIIYILKNEDEKIGKKIWKSAPILRKYITNSENNEIHIDEIQKYITNDDNNINIVNQFCEDNKIKLLK